VSSWTEPRISVQATRRSLFGRAELDQVSISVTEGRTVTVRAEHPPPPARASVDYVVMVPATVGSVRVETSNGRLEAEAASPQVTSRSGRATGTSISRSRRGSMPRLRPGGYA
jgi:hypothetical protein